MPSDSGVQIIAGGDTLQDNEKIAQLLTQLMQTGQAEQAANIRQLCGYVDSLEKQYAAVMSELQGIKEQLSEATAQKRPLRVQVSDAVQTAETALKQARDQLPTLKEDLAIWAETTANDLRRVGISVLDNTVAFLNIQQILENIRDALESALQSVRSAIHQVETMGQELREAGNHLANAGRAAAGREIQPKDVTQEGRFQAVVLAPHRHDPYNAGRCSQRETAGAHGGREPGQAGAVLCPAEAGAEEGDRVPGPAQFAPAGEKKI